MAPSGKAYDVDWIMSWNSNVHVATDRDWFTTFTPFDTYYGSIFTDSRTEVLGIGSVELEIKIHANRKRGRPNSRTITIDNVLYAPNAICNIFAPSSDDKYTFRTGPGKFGAVMDSEGNDVGLMERPYLLRLWLHGRRNPNSSLDTSKLYIINAYWPSEEIIRWNTHLTQLRSVASSVNAEEQPYNSAEKTWLKKNFGSEYKFLQQHGLHIYKEADRAEGRSIVRRWMSEDEEQSPEPIPGIYNVFLPMSEYHKYEY